MFRSDSGAFTKKSTFDFSLNFSVVLLIDIFLYVSLEHNSKKVGKKITFKMNCFFNWNIYNCEKWIQYMTVTRYEVKIDSFHSVMSFDLKYLRKKCLIIFHTFYLLTFRMWNLYAFRTATNIYELSISRYQNVYLLQLLSLTSNGACDDVINSRCYSTLCVLNEKLKAQKIIELKYKFQYRVDI